METASVKPAGVTLAVDWDAVEAAGLLADADDVDDRRALIELLTERGMGLDDLVDAHARGALIRVGGEASIRPDAGTLGLDDVAAQAGTDAGSAQRILRTLGAVDPDRAGWKGSPADVELVEIALEILERFGERTGWSLLRRYGALVERFTEATSSAVITELPDISMVHTGSEAATARRWNDVADFIPRLGRLMDLSLRHHVEGVRRYFEQAGAGLATQGSFEMAVGFADLSGYTAASLVLDLREVAGLVAAFEDRATDAVTSRGGRVVKFVGDAVLYVCSDPDALLEISLAIVADTSGLQARAGCARGWVLARDGDYFGPAVNLAARLVSTASPGEVVAADELVAGIDAARWSVTARPPAPLHGIEGDVTTHVIAPAGD